MIINKGCCVVVPGSLAQETVVVPFATTVRAIFVSTTSVFELSCFPREDSLPVFSFPLFPFTLLYFSLSFPPYGGSIFLVSLNYFNSQKPNEVGFLTPPNIPSNPTSDPTPKPQKTHFQKKAIAP
jgi:hypothetical protein